MISRQTSILSTTSYSHSHPQKIGPWKLGKTLGRGSTGRVLLGVHETTGQKAAVKVVSKLELNEDNTKQAKGSLPYGIEREIIIMKLLTHPNVLRLYDVWETSKALYLVLEYVEGGELFDLLVERGPLHEQEAVKYFRQIILGTAYCHALGICHRDLKPENLLLDSSLNVKLADFGMAALESNGKLLETSCGSPHYAAPEIVSGLKYHGAASDVWSCGVILFALLTGRLPFDDENIRNLLLKVQAGNFEMPSELSPEAQDLIWKMLTVDPMDRIATNNVLKHRLLKKYPVPNEDLISVRSLPHPETAHRSLGSAKNIDKQILENLCILWNQRPEEEIIRALVADGQNPEKTFYALLLRYRHIQDEPQQTNAMVAGSPRKKIPRSTSSTSNKIATTPKRNRSSQIASNPRNRPVSFQRRYGAKTSNSASRNSFISSVANLPYKSPSRFQASFSQSPSKSPGKSRSYHAHADPLPRDIYNDLMAATPANKSYDSMPPTLPSKDSIYADTPGIDRQEQAHNGHGPSTLGDAPNLEMSSQLLPPPRSTSYLSKRTSILKSSTSKTNKRRSVRQSLTTGLKRNSITIKLLSTYAKLSSETDWEYIDKQTRRTSATFATLCDKIFNHEDYNEEDELLVNEDDKRLKEYERLMEAERKKHEMEFKARRELAKQKKRQSRRSLISSKSSKKLHITVTEDTGTDRIGSDMSVIEEISQPKRQQKLANGLRSVSEGIERDLTAADLEIIKRRSATQPTQRRRQTPVLTRRPISRLDPLWIAFENKEITRAQDALEAEFGDYERKKINRESMISVSCEETPVVPNGGFPQGDQKFELPQHLTEDFDLSEEYMNEIRKSRLLNSQYNIHAHLEEGTAKRSSTVKKKSGDIDRRTLIDRIEIPKVTRRSSHFSNSNKRLSLLTLKSTKESYRDLNSFLDTHKEDLEDDELNEEEQMTKTMPQLRTSYADRLNRAASTHLDNLDEDEQWDTGSVLDLDEHLANKRVSYYSTKNNSKPLKSMLLDSTEVAKRKSPVEADFTFSEDDVKNNTDDGDVFETIKLPETSGPNARNSKASGKEAQGNGYSQGNSRASQRVSAYKGRERTLIPQAEKVNQEINQGKSYGGLKNKDYSVENVPILPSMGSSDQPSAPQKRSRSFFRKLSWGSKKVMNEEPYQLPSPPDSGSNSLEEKKVGLFSRLFVPNEKIDVVRYKTILPKHEMMSALFALLNSWSNFGLKELKKDIVGFNITGSIPKGNSFHLKSCKFRIKISARENNQKSTLICAHVKGSAVTSTTLFREIQKVLEKEGVLEK